MAQTRRTAAIVGVLFIIATVGFLVGQAIHGPVLNELALAVWLLVKGFTGPGAVPAPERDVHISGTRT